MQEYQSPHSPGTHMGHPSKPPDSTLLCISESMRVCGKRCARPRLFTCHREKERNAFRCGSHSRDAQLRPRCIHNRTRKSDKGIMQTLTDVPSSTCTRTVRAQHSICDPNPRRILPEILVPKGEISLSPSLDDHINWVESEFNIQFPYHNPAWQKFRFLDPLDVNVLPPFCAVMKSVSVLAMPYPPRFFWK